MNSVLPGNKEAFCGDNCDSDFCLKVDVNLVQKVRFSFNIKICLSFLFILPEYVISVLLKDKYRTKFVVKKKKSSSVWTVATICDTVLHRALSRGVRIPDLLVNSQEGHPGGSKRNPVGN